ncbi:OmpL47-type beta-barrel domain-containing protein [Streptomyces sp. NPDC005248]|uniref:OmpL47-type beta-barrel domain-containing protein n=1 Tax=Streptomyces sp. NPDC005248 TaxID=3364709 RepID=UPI0036C719C7
MRPGTRLLVALLATCATLFAPFSLVTGTAAAVSTTDTTAAAATAAASVPEAGILDVDFADGTPTDHAQNLAVTGKGTPSITNDRTVGKDVATFNGSTEAYTYPFSGQWSKLTGGFSVECRFRWNGASIPTSGQKAICSNAQSGGADLQIDGGQLAFSVNVGGYKYTHAPIIPGQWYDAVATWDGRNVNLYVDGVLASTTAAAGSLTVPASGAQNWTLGADSASNGGIETPSPVSISTANVWNTALSADQVAAFVRQNATPPADAPDCTAYQKEIAAAADAAAGTVVVDEDFSDPDAIECWNQASGSAPWKVSDGRLVGASPATNDQPVITFGPHLDDYLFRATARFDSVLKPTDPWFALIADTPAYGARPYPAFAVRTDTTAVDGVRAMTQNATSSAALKTASYGSDLGTGTDVDIALEVHDTLANFYVNGKLVLANVTIPRTTTGVIGLYLDSATVSFNDVSLTKLGLLGTAGFMTDTLRLPAVPVSGAVHQPLAGLWRTGWVGQGPASVDFTKVSGDNWLDVSADGVVTGTAPDEVPQDDAAITVSATDGTTTSQILVQVPVAAADAAPQIQSASWNAWDGGSHVTDAVAKNVAVIATQGITVVGFQDGGADMAQKVGDALGWHVHSAGDVGIVSAYPIADANRVSPTDVAPAAAVTLDVAGTPVRVWDAHLDETDYGPYRACFDEATDLAAHEKTTTRYAQAQGLAQKMAGDLSGSTPVLLLGDLASPSGADWTAATSGSHCDAGAVDWPVPDVFADRGLTDSYRVVNPDPEPDPGNTWSPITSTHGAGQNEPQDRIDYVWYAGDDLHVEEAHALTVGWPSEDDVADNSWASDHAAAVTTFTLGGGSAAPVPDLPTVSVDDRTIAYQVGQGPADAAAFLSDIKATADPADATLAVDLADVDFDTPGWYTALVTATSGRYTSNPVAMTVRVAPVPGLVLSADTATFGVGDTIDEPAVLAQLEPILDVPGAVNVGLSGVNNWVPADYPVTVTATDQWGFRVTRSATVRVVGTPDTTAPVITTAIAPADPDGRNDWYMSAPTINASATDDEGVEPTLEYRVGDGEWTPYTERITVDDGASPYDFRATDRAGNVSNESVTVKADQVAPSTTAFAESGATVITPVTVTLTATDTTSGVAGTEYRVGDADWAAYTAPFMVTPTTSDQTVSYRSTDAAGNVERAHHLVIPAIKPVKPTVTATAPEATYTTAAKVTVAVSSPGLPATGSVTLAEGTADGTKARGKADLVDGKAVFTLPSGLAVGSHDLTASYAGSDLLTPATATVTVTVGLSAAWGSSKIYDTGDTVGYQGKLYMASWWTKNQKPGDPYGPWQEISMTEDGTSMWTASRIYQAGDVVIHRGTKYKAKWYTRNQLPGDPNGPWAVAD